MFKNCNKTCHKSSNESTGWCVASAKAPASSAASRASTRLCSWTLTSAWVYCKVSSKRLSCHNDGISGGRSWGLKIWCLKAKVGVGVFLLISWKNTRVKLKLLGRLSWKITRQGDPNLSRDVNSLRDETRPSFTDFWALEVEGFCTTSIVKTSLDDILCLIIVWTIIYFLKKKKKKKT